MSGKDTIPDNLQIAKRDGRIQRPPHCPMHEAVSAVIHSPVSSHRTALVIGEDRASVPANSIACVAKACSPILAQGAVNHITIQNVPLEDIIGERFSRGTNISDNTF